MRVRCLCIHGLLCAGQSTVQVVEDTCTHVRYAIKFFVSTSAFEKERGLYTDARQPLGRFLPQLHSVAERPEELLKDAHGEVLPPCIIMEKGDALDAWVQNCCEGPDSGVDQVTGIQVRLLALLRKFDVRRTCLFGYTRRNYRVLKGGQNPRFRGRCKSLLLIMSLIMFMLPDEPSENQELLTTGAVGRRLFSRKAL